MHTRESLRVVLNTSPLIVLVKLGILKEALNLFSEVEVPHGVLEEIERRRDEVYRELTKLIAKGKIHVEDIRKRLPRLGLGESSVIFLALVKNKVVILDDKRARKLARELGLEVIGTQSILKKLYEKGILKEAPNTLYRHLIEMGFHIDKELFDKVFREGSS